MVEGLREDCPQGGRRRTCDAILPPPRRQRLDLGWAARVDPTPGSSAWAF